MTDNNKTKYELADLNSYQLPESPLQNAIMAEVRAIYNAAQSSNDDEYKRWVEDGLYFAVKSRMMLREYNNDKLTYLTGLISDIREAKNHYSQVCYTSRVTESVFSRLQQVILNLLVTS